ncbi:MAG: hypothetical protein M3436_05920 [Pseudomonadota bacterium]|nr:hypothetical protein [Pseudomonadota bacterium]
MVSDTQGAASYSWPIQVPPGRNGVQPKLALSYSSAGALRGGIAVGFSQELPTIERDPQYPSTPVYRLRGLGDDQRLVRVTGDGTAVTGVTMYRPELDTSFTRVTKQAKAWTVRTPDGMTRLFEATTDASGVAIASDLATRWNLTRERDAFGNEVVYTWSRYTNAQGYVDFTLQKIEYTSNPAAGLGPHARVELSYYGAIVTCTGSAVPAGARTDHHSASSASTARGP